MSSGDAGPTVLLPGTSRFWTGPSVAPVALSFVVMVALVGLDWIGLAPNRLVTGEGFPAWRALGVWCWPVALAPLAAATARNLKGLERRGAAVLSTAVLLAAAVALPVLTARAAAPLLAGHPPAARVWLGAGFWVALGALVLLVVMSARDTAWRIAPTAAVTVLVLSIAGAFAAGALDTLSLALEIRARGDLLGPAIVRHLALAGGSLALGLALAIPIAWAAFASRPVEAVSAAGLKAIQVVPAIALLAALVPLLSRVLGAVPTLRQVGVAAIGPAPAVIGVGAYLALPLVSSFLAALRSADPAIVDAARGMGLAEGRITRAVRLPLGIPILIAGLRLGTVQAIGLSTLGGLIGAGGLGGVVFEGMAQFAPDLILLGAAPIVVMALAADVGLRALEVRLAAATGRTRE